MTTDDEKKQQRKTMIMWYIVILVVILIAVGAWWFYSKEGHSMASPSVSPSTASSQASFDGPAYRFKFY